MKFFEEVSADRFVVCFGKAQAKEQAGEARRAAADMARSLGFGEEDVGRVTIVVTECANNLWKHAEGGEMLITECENRI